MKKMVLSAGGLVFTCLSISSVVSCNNNKVFNKEKLIEDFLKMAKYDIPKKINKKDLIKILIGFLDGGLKNVDKDLLKKIHLSDGWSEWSSNVYISLLFNSDFIERIVKKGFKDFKIGTKQENEKIISKWIDSFLPKMDDQNKRIFTNKLITKVFIGFDNFNEFENILSKTKIKLPKKVISESLFLNVPIFKKGILYSGINDWTVTITSIWFIFDKLNKIENQDFSNETIKALQPLKKLSDLASYNIKNKEGNLIDIEDLKKPISSDSLPLVVDDDQIKKVAKITYDLIAGGLFNILGNSDAISYNPLLNIDSKKYLEKFWEILNEGFNGWEEKLSEIIENYKNRLVLPK